jgi:phage shock protein A
MLRFTATLIVCTVALFGLACSEDEGANSDAESDRDAFIQDAEERIGDLRAELDQLRDDIATGEAAEDVKQQADQLDERINDAEAELDEVRSASDDEWQALRDSLNQTLDDAGDLADKIGNELGLN